MVCCNPASLPCGKCCVQLTYLTTVWLCHFARHLSQRECVGRVIARVQMKRDKHMSTERINQVGECCGVFMGAFVPTPVRPAKWLIRRVGE